MGVYLSTETAFPLETPEQAIRECLKLDDPYKAPVGSALPDRF